MVPKLLFFAASLVLVVVGLSPRARADESADKQNMERAFHLVKAAVDLQREGKHDLALEALTEAARGEGHLMPLIVDAVKAYASVGEISDAFRGVFGTYSEGG